MDAAVVVGIVAGAAAHFVYENARVFFYADARADAVAIRFGALRFDGDPMIGSTDLVDEKTGRRVHVADHRGKFAFIPKIADREAARGTVHGNAGPGGGGNVVESAVPQIV